MVHRTTQGRRARATEEWRPASRFGTGCRTVAGSLAARTACIAPPGRQVNRVVDTARDRRHRPKDHRSLVQVRLRDGQEVMVGVLGVLGVLGRLASVRGVSIWDRRASQGIRRTLVRLEANRQDMGRPVAAHRDLVRLGVDRVRVDRLVVIRCGLGHRSGGIRCARDRHWAAEW
jgi:hypothetical protein